MYIDGGKYMKNWSEVEEDLVNNPNQPRIWQEWAMALHDEEKIQEGQAIFSRGISYNPFDALLYLMRGRKWIGQGLYDMAISDMALSSRLNPFDWETWYYMGVACNISGQRERALCCFWNCADLVPTPSGMYPVVDWLFVTNTELGRKEEAARVLDLVDLSTPYSPSDYSYGMRIRLFKEVITPEEFLDEESMKTAKTPALSIITMLYGLAFFYTWKGIIEKSDQTLRKLLDQPSYHTAFGYIKGCILAKERGII